MYKLFDKWEYSDIQVDDMSMSRYINIKPVIVPYSGGKHAKKKFNKSNQNIVERLINKIMLTELNTGKKMMAYRIVENSFDIINKKTKENPIQVLVNAVINAGPREETVRLKYGGIAVPKAVDSAPQRRVDVALKLIANGAQKSSFKSRRSIEEALANEIIAAANYDVKSYSINKKEGKERVAKAAR
ncbi:MAG: 30S ribosomal protein S7 [ANME-2 cluster archaeon HR1]|jgi:small subunit ribosomal protein S7|nr:MAG: small subunit ribosomal protein S7 [ANME-2 cluster archaeon]KAF5426485.1 small subunit ribosomal protein S7 [ANME-2 cluster archaeon]MCK5217260.1 30S ribosomal protein S7 [Methanosarcinales archaeon]MEA3293890.1 30S ribosomal protein S7 [Euryarchaeota archaeon]PPA80446.1 MAG: 30S ribosomal protein S7 [ANME-2 cluster archaeon HR1]